MEEQLAAGLGEGQIAEFVEHHEVEAAQVVGDAALPAGPSLGVEPVEQVDDVEEARAGAAADAGAGDGGVALAGSGAADQHDVALLLNGEPPWLYRRGFGSRVHAAFDRRWPHSRKCFSASAGGIYPRRRIGD